MTSMPSLRMRTFAWLLLGMFACGGAQQGYYDACAEPAGLVLGCDTPDPEELTAWDACTKLAQCGVILVEEDDDDNPDTPPVFEVCIDRIEESFDAQGDNVLACIDEAHCPDLVAAEPVDGDDPDVSSDAIEGVIGYCGRLYPQ